LWQAGAYEPPSTSGVLARLDPTDTSRSTLLNDNFFGNKLRFTDTAGNRSSVGAGVPDRLDFVNHDFAGATPNVVIDHRYGCMYYIERIQDGTVNDMSTTASGQSWYDWLTFIGSLNIGGHDDWLPILNNTDLPHAYQANFGESTYNNFFSNPERADERANFITGESFSATQAYLLRDLGNVELSQGGTSGEKSGVVNAFQGGLSKIFVMRMLTSADITALTA
jgi:hypothetical protein